MPQLPQSTFPHDAIRIERGDHLPFPFALVVDGDLDAVVAAPHIALVGQRPAFGIYAMALGLSGLGDADQVADLASHAAVGLAALLDAAVAQDTVAGLLHHGAFEAVVGLVADPDVAHGAFHMGAVGGPGQRHVFDQACQTIFTRLRIGLGEALHHALVGHADHAGIHRMMAVVVAVLLAVQAQHVVQAKLAAQQRRHLAWDYPRGAAGAHQPQVFRRHARKVARVVERTGQEVLVLAQPAFVAVGREAVALAQRHALGALQDAVIAPALGLEVGAGFPRRAVALDAVGFAQCHRAVVQAVVQGHRERQDVLDLHALAQQHARADLHAAVGTAAVGSVVAQLFPQDPFLDVQRAHALFADAQHLGDGAADARVALLVVRLPLLRFQLLFAALLEVARQLDHHFGRPAIAAHQRIDHHAHLVQSDVDGGVGDLAVALFVVAWVVLGKRYMPLQGTAVVGQLLEGEDGLDFPVEAMVRSPMRSTSSAPCSKLKPRSLWCAKPAACTALS